MNKVTLRDFGEVEIIEETDNIVKIKNKYGTIFPIGKKLFEDQKIESQTETQPETQVEPQAEPVQREILNGNTSTGSVYREGNKVYKPTTFKQTGNKTLEGEVYSALEGTEGVAQGKVVIKDNAEMIETPYYKNVISVDDILKKRRKSLSNIVKGNIERINNAISELTNKGYSYSDPLQFGVNNSQMDLMDFSNATKSENALEDNYMHLSQFYRQFGLDKQADIIENAIRYKELAELYTSEDIKKDAVLIENAKKERLSYTLADTKKGTVFLDDAEKRNTF